MAHDVLVVDDECDIRTLVSEILEDEGYQARTAHDGVSAIESIQMRRPSLVILDVWLGDSERDGLKILEQIKRDHPYVPVIMISGHGTIETAVSAIKKGAYDFLEKPFQIERLLMLVERAIESSMLRMENDTLKKKAGTPLALLGSTAIMTAFRLQVEKLASTKSRIFIKGPLGSEKEVVARSIHDMSTRARNPFISLSCRTIHPQFVESELFGLDVTSKDTEETPRKIGVVEQAHTGTLFLEDIDAIPLPVQAKLLKLIQENTFSRVGSQNKIDVDVRIIVGSSHIETALREGSFREDLYYRLAISTLEVPPLAARVLDIPSLIQAMAEEYATRHGAPLPKFSEDALAVLQSYTWPGNLTQLKNMMDWIAIHNTSSNNQPITAQSLPHDILNQNHVDAAWNKSAEIVILPLKQARESFERDYLMAQVRRFGGNISKTARFIGMERSALHRKLRTLGVGTEESDEDDACTNPSLESRGSS